MRVVTVLLSFMALIATSVLSVAVIKLRRQLAETRADLGSLREFCRVDSEPFGWQAEDDGRIPMGRSAPPAAPSAPRLAPAALAPSGSNQPSPSLASPETRAEVKKLVAEHLAEQQQQREAVREQREVQRRERMAAELGLDESQKARFAALLAATQAEWRQLREQERSGDKAPADLRPQLEASRQRADQAMRELLGEEKMKQYESMRAGPRGIGPGAMPGGGPAQPNARPR
jgi:hypothetical protein